MSYTHGTGTLQNHRIPPDCDLGTDAALIRCGRCGFIQSVRIGGHVCVIKLLNSKPVVLASIIHV